MQELPSLMAGSGPRVVRRAYMEAFATDVSESSGSLSAKILATISAWTQWKSSQRQDPDGSSGGGRPR